MDAARTDAVSTLFGRRWVLNAIACLCDDPVVQGWLLEGVDSSNRSLCAGASILDSIRARASASARAVWRIDNKTSNPNSGVQVASGLLR